MQKRLEQTPPLTISLYLFNKSVEYDFDDAGTILRLLSEVEVLTVVMRAHALLLDAFGFKGYPLLKAGEKAMLRLVVGFEHDLENLEGIEADLQVELVKPARWNWARLGTPYGEEGVDHRPYLILRGQVVTSDGYRIDLLEKPNEKPLEVRAFNDIRVEGLRIAHFGSAQTILFQVDWSDIL